MDKQIFRGKLQTIKNNYAMAQLGITLMSLPNSQEQFEWAMEQLSDRQEIHTFSYIDYVFQSDDLFKLATKEFRNATLRNCLKEIFELIKLYGDQTNQSSVFQAAPWYQFLRMIRNCLSHDMQIHFNAVDLKKLPVSWNGVVLEQSLQNKPLPMKDFFSRLKALKLIDEVIEYAEKNIQ